MSRISARFKELDEYLDRPYRFRRIGLLIPLVVILGLLVECNITNHTFNGADVAITILGGNSLLYGGTKIVDGLRKNKLNDVQGDI